MIKINAIEPDTRIWLRWRADCKKATEALVQAVQQGHEIEISALYRRKSIKKAFYFSKDGPFHGKCAYCECYLADFQRGDVEHFRPKKAVSDAFGQSVPHPGYYWLAYNWRNLLPSCQMCNQLTEVKDQVIGKGTRFPVMGTHATTPETVIEEEPLLIHPAIENPGDHLFVDPNTGMMLAKTARGEMCIDIFGLNLRDRLPEGRKKAANAVRANVIELLLNPAAKETVEGEIKSVQQGACEYAAAGRAKLAEMQTVLDPILSDG